MSEYKLSDRLKEIAGWIEVGGNCRSAHFDDAASAAADLERDVDAIRAREADRLGTQRNLLRRVEELEKWKRRCDQFNGLSVKDPEPEPGECAHFGMAAFDRLRGDRQWEAFVNRIYAEPRYNAPHRMTHVRALEIAALAWVAWADSGRKRERY